MANLQNRHLPFWTITLAVIIGTIVPVLIQNGMFMDGVLYAAVSNNMANGIGTFWFPEFSELGFSGNKSFHEHPPLVFWLQSLFFKLFGSSIYVERLYSFVTALITAGIIAKLWRMTVTDRPELRKMAWLPVLFWILIPVTFWSHQNNVHENTMGIFTLLAGYFILKGLFLEKQIYLNLILGGIFIFLATFSKGVPGLFPVGIAGLFWIVTRRYTLTRIALYTLILILVPVVIYGILMLSNDGYEALKFYLEERVIGRIANQPTTNHRLYILQKLPVEMSAVMLLSVIMLFVYRRRSIDQQMDRKYKNRIVIFMLIGAIGSLPIMLTLIQKAFYFTPALPFFAVGFALLVAPGAKLLIDRMSTKSIGYKLFLGSSGLFLAGAIAASVANVGETRKDAGLINDIREINSVVPSGSTVSIDHSNWNDWELQCYLIRYAGISVDPFDMTHEYYLTEKSANISGKVYKQLDLDTERYAVFQLPPVSP